MSIRYALALAIALGTGGVATAGPAAFDLRPSVDILFDDPQAPRVTRVRRLVAGAAPARPAPPSASTDKAADAWGECIGMNALGNAGAAGSAESVVDGAFRACAAQELATYNAVARSVGNAPASQVATEFDKMKRETRTMMILEVNKFRAGMSGR